MKLHMDGARLMNAAVASNQDVKTICKNVDSVNICFSKVKKIIAYETHFMNIYLFKGMGAPVGAILAGSKEFIARFNIKLFLFYILIYICLF
jgi:threonine aldolase